MLVLPERTSAEDQRVAFETTEQEPSTGQSLHVVGTQDDARQLSDCVSQARFEREDVLLGGPAGMLPPEVSEDSHHRHSRP